MTITMTLDEYHDLKTRALSPEQMRSKRDRLIKAARDFIGGSGMVDVSGRCQRFVFVVTDVFKHESEISLPTGAKSEPSSGGSGDSLAAEPASPRT